MRPLTLIICLLFSCVPILAEATQCSIEYVESSQSNSELIEFDGGKNRDSSLHFLFFPSQYLQHDFQWVELMFVNEAGEATFASQIEARSDERGKHFSELALSSEIEECVFVLVMYEGCVSLNKVLKPHNTALKSVPACGLDPTRAAHAPLN